jgi:hypothetical protein
MPRIRRRRLLRKLAVASFPTLEPTPACVRRAAFPSPVWRWMQFGTASFLRCSSDVSLARRAVVERPKARVIGMSLTDDSFGSLPTPSRMTRRTGWLVHLRRTKSSRGLRAREYGRRSREPCSSCTRRRGARTRDARVEAPCRSCGARSRDGGGSLCQLDDARVGQRRRDRGVVRSDRRGERARKSRGARARIAASLPDAGPDITPRRG